MLRRLILPLSSCRSDRRIPIQITSQIPSFLSSRKSFSVESHQNGPQGSGSNGKPPQSGDPLPKIIVGSVALGAAFIAAYSTGYLDKYLVKEPHGTLESDKMASIHKDAQVSPENSKSLHANDDAREPVATPKYSDEEPPNVEHADQRSESLPDPTFKNDSTIIEESQFQEKDTPELKEGGSEHHNQEHAPSSTESSSISDETSTDSSKLSEDSLDHMAPEVKLQSEQHTAVEVAPPLTQDSSVPSGNDTRSVPLPEITSQDSPKDDLDRDIVQPSSLIDEYLLRDKGGEPAAAGLRKSEIEDAYISKDGKLVLDFLQAIHAAEQTQADLDARVYGEQKRMLKEKYERELKDAMARELMYAERETILEKELKREKAKAVAALKSLQEKLEEKHKVDLQEKETEADMKLKKMQELAKAQLAAAVASEKASQIEKMAEANLNINALCMAFYARSEEARQSHSMHKLALGALALEDALSRGLPIQKDIEALNTYIEGIDKDSLFELVLSSLPEETRKNGTDTVLQLNHKFDTLKATLRHFSLIPPSGGGILSHSLAHVASRLKVRETNPSGDGIESVIIEVEKLLAQGKLREAADALESGVKGTKAAEVVDDWVRQARNRAVTEQALTLLRSYATSINLT